MLTVTSLSLVLKLMFIDRHALVFDEATHVMIAKSFVAKGFNWQTMRVIGSTFPPTQYFVMGWTWLLSGQLNIAVSEEAIFRIPSVFMSSLAIPFVYLTSRHHGRAVSIIASLTFAFHPYIVAYSRLAIMDMPAVFWLTVGIYCYMQFFYAKEEDSIRSPWIWLAGVFFGISAFTKPPYGLVFIPVLIHAFTNEEYSRRRSAVRVCQLVSMMAAVVIIISVIGTGNPFILYDIFKETAQTSTLPVSFWTRPWTGVTLFTHLGGMIFILSIVGLLLLLFQNRKLNRVNLFYGLFATTFLVAFTGFHFGRYLLIVTPVLSITFGYAIVWGYRKFKPMGKSQAMRARTRMNPGSLVRITILAMIVSLALVDFLPLSRIYEAKIIDDYWHTEGFREIGAYMRQSGKPTNLALTNGHFNVIEYYSGIDTNLYMGMSEDGFITVYWMYYNGTPVVLNKISWVDEDRLRFFVLVGDPKMIRPDKVLFWRDQEFSWVKPDDFLGYYLSTYFRSVILLEEDDVPLSLYERRTQNIFSLMPNPTVYVGESGAELTSNFVNWNGFILGNGWSSPYNIEKNGTICCVRNAVRDDQKGLFSSFILFVRDPNRDVVLRVTYVDVGSGPRVVATACNTTLVEGKVEFLTMVLGKIYANDTGSVKVAEFDIPHNYFYDVSNITAGHQQLFGLYTYSNFLPITKVELVTKR